jgi:hypothetical protein
VNHSLSDQPSRITYYVSRLTHYAVRTAPYALLFLAFFVRVTSISYQSLWRDEVDAIRFGSDLSTQIGGALTGGGLDGLVSQLRDTLTKPGFNGPLYFLMLRGWIGLAGQSEFAIRFLSLACGVISVALIIILGTRLFNRSIGLIASALLTFSAYHVWYSQEAKMYTLITLLALAAIYCLRRGVEEGRIRFWIAVVICTSFAMYAHILAALLIPVEVALFIVWWPLSRKHIDAGLITLAFLIVPYLPIAQWQVQLAFTPGETGFGHFTLGEILGVLGMAYTRGILNSLSENGGNITSGLAAALAVFGLLASNAIVQRPYRRSSSLILAAWLAIPVLAIYIISINRPVFTDRYLIWLMPAYYLLIAVGLATSWKWLRPIAMISLIALLYVGALGIYTQATTPYKSDFRSAAQAIEARVQPGDLIVFQIPYIQYTFNYYYHQPYQFVPGPYTNYPGPNDGYQDTTATVNLQLDRTFKDRRSVWLVASEMDMWDNRHVLQHWLDAHGTIAYRADFAQVQVTRYELRQ